MGNYLKGLDKIGPEIGYNFGRRPRYESTVGGVMTMLVYGFMAFVGYKMIIKIFDT
jgi:hypothetical protein